MFATKIAAGARRRTGTRAPLVLVLAFLAGVVPAAPARAVVEAPGANAAIDLVAVGLQTELLTDPIGIDFQASNTSTQPPIAIPGPRLSWYPRSAIAVTPPS